MLGKISHQLADSEYVESATLPHKITAAVWTKTPTVSRHPGGRRRWRDRRRSRSTAHLAAAAPGL